MIEPTPLDVIGSASGAPVVVLGTRRSALARTQARAFAESLATASGWTVRIMAVVTEGDVNMAPLAQMGGTGVFVSAVREALTAGEIDVAVHSLKDLPTAPQPGIELAAVPGREDPRDVLVSRADLPLNELPAGAVVATGSPRRAAQLAALRPDLEVRGIRGNVDTRIRAVTGGSVDAVVLAAAGLRRLGRQAEISEAFGPESMLPAPGQGALGVECRPSSAARPAPDRPSDAEIHAALSGLDDARARAAVTAERAVLARAEAGCSAPIGALAEVSGDDLTLTAVLADDDGRLLRKELHGPAAEAYRTGAELADRLLEGLGYVPGDLGGRAPGSA